MAVQQLTSRQMRMRWQDWLNACFGVWLIIAPMVGVGQLDDPAAWNSYLIGALVVVLAGAAIGRVRPWEEWTNLVAGFWLLISPFSLHFTDQAGVMWNQIIVGAFIIIASGWVLFDVKGGNGDD
ncbi:MAG: SPW repeat protein [Arenicellales bacterium]|jgi:hypothetical protein